MTETERAVMQQALDALKVTRIYLPATGATRTNVREAIAALESDIAQPVQPKETD